MCHSMTAVVQLHAHLDHGHAPMSMEHTINVLNQNKTAFLMELELGAELFTE